MFIKNCWYVAGWSREVPDDGFLARTVVNVPLALWRDSQGQVRALADRCCHRGAPLSMGRREGDCVRCAVLFWLMNTGDGIFVATTKLFNAFFLIANDNGGWN